jgi:hypothetical protein
MAGSVIISPDEIWSCSGPCLALIVRETRKQISSDSLNTDAFAPYNEEAGFIALDELDRDSFHTFLAATERAHAEYTSCGSITPAEYKGVLLSWWSELISRLKCDPRAATPA